MRNLIISIIAASLAAGLMLSSAAFAGKDGDSERGSPERGQGHGRGHGGPGGGGAFMHELQDLDLTDAQKSQIKGFFDAKRDQVKGSRQAMHDLLRKHDLATPGSPAYATLTAQLADAEAAQARERVTQMAEMRTQVYSVLTEAQRKKLAEEIASRPEPKALREPKPR